MLKIQNNNFIICMCVFLIIRFYNDTQCTCSVLLSTYVINCTAYCKTRSIQLVALFELYLYIILIKPSHILYEYMDMNSGDTNCLVLLFGIFSGLLPSRQIR